MNEHFVYRRPYRRGDFEFVARPREGAYWRSRDGLIVRIASGEGTALSAQREAPAWLGALALRVARAART